MKSIARALEVDVRRFDRPAEPLEEASLVLERRGRAVPIEIEYSEAHGAHLARDVVPGAYDLEVSAAGLDPQKRKVRVGPDGGRELFVLGKAAMRSFQRGPVTVPFEENDLIAIAFRATVGSSRIEEIEDTLHLAERPEVSDLPLEAIPGISPEDADLLREALDIETLEELAEHRFVTVTDDEGTRPAFGRPLDRGFEKRDPARLPDAPVRAIRGVAAKGADLLAEHFGIRTLGDLARHDVVTRAAARELRKTRLYRIPAGQEAGKFLKSVSDRFQDEVERAGQVILPGATDGDSNLEGPFSYLTDELVVRFRAGTTGRALRRVLRDHTSRRLPYALDTWVLKTNRPATYEVLEIAEKIRKLPEVDWVEPNLGGTAELDSIWDRERVGSRAARDTLEKIETSRGARKSRKSGAADPPPSPSPGSGTRSSGAEGPPASPASGDVVLAVVDSGLDDRHEKLPRGKIVKLYDFRREAEDNREPLYGSSHGMKVAGIAAAADVDGGRAGVVGVAPACKVMGLVFPRTELDILDMYVWAAGIDPGRDKDWPGGAWPDPPERGADIFVTSVGFGCCTGAPISGLARMTFEKLTTEGRGGRGCLLFFSAGNRPRDCTLDRPWTASDRTFGISASSEVDGVEKLATYSGFGPIELCAPSSYDLRTLRTSTLVHGGLDGYTDSEERYTDSFGGTSSATPLAAGVAALVLSARPELTWAEVRQILRLSAEPIDAADASWVDVFGEPATGESGTGLPPVYSRRYGYGRVSAEAAIQLALRFSRHVCKGKGKVSDPPGSLQIALEASTIVREILASWVGRLDPSERDDDDFDDYDEERVYSTSTTPDTPLQRSKKPLRR